jgi:hypothetical protein
MEGFLGHPGVQGGIAPFVVGLVVAAVLGRARLGGLAVPAAFCVAVALIEGLTFTPLTATRKIVLLGLAALLAGIAIDFEAKVNRTLAMLVAVVCGALTVWVFWSVLRQKPPADAALLGGLAAAFVAWLVVATMTLAGEPVRAGAAALILGLGAGIAAILGASAKLGLFGIAVGAGAGGYLLWQMVTNRTIPAGATLTLSAAVTAGLLAAGAMFLAQLPWYALIPLALIPLAVRLPAPRRPWLQAIIVSAYGFAVAVVAFVLTWRAPPPG